MRSLALAHVLDAGADVLHDSVSYQLGVWRRGAGTSRAAVASDGMLLVTLGGVHELALGRERGGDWQRVSVGRRPTAVLLSPDSRQAYVANTFADSVSIVDLETQRLRAEIPLEGGWSVRRARRVAFLRCSTPASDGWLAATAVTRTATPMGY